MSTHTIRTIILLTTSILTFGAAFDSNADDEFKFSGEMVVELQNEYAHDSDDLTVDGYNQMFLRSEVAANLEIGQHLFIDGVAVLEPLFDADGNESNYFDDQGVFIEEIKLNYARNNWAVFAGKFNPAFGIAWDYGRGIWSEDFAEDYEITERLGFGGTIMAGNENIGQHSFTASTFFADTSFLSGSIGTARPHTSKADGGLANTEDFSSFVLAFTGENLAGVDNLYYKLGYRYQAQGEANTGGADEKGYAITIGHVFDVTERVNVDALVEYVDIQNFGASKDDNLYFTTSIITTLDDQWNATLGYTARNIDSAGGDNDDQLLQVSAGYNFGQGTTAELGWKSTKENGLDTNIIGGLIRHTAQF